jgi:hypothetical protein
MRFGIQLHLNEGRQVSKRAKKFSSQDWPKVDHLLRFVVNPHAKSAR